MYKKRLKTWNLTKNLSVDDMPEILHEAEKGSTAKNTMLMIRGKLVDSQKVARYMRQKMKNTTTSTSLLNPASLAFFDVSQATYGLNNWQKCRELRNLGITKPTWLASPDALRIPEEVIKISHQFIDGSIGISATEHRVPKSVTFPFKDTLIWQAGVYYAISLIRQQQFKHGFMLLHKSCGDLEGLILSSDLSLFLCIYTSILMLPSGVGQELLSYVAHMSRVILPACHPTRLIWARLRHIGLNQAWYYASPILSSYLSTLERRFSAFDQTIFLSTTTAYDGMSRMGLLSLESSEMIFKRIIRQLDSSHNTKETLYAKLGLALAYRRHEEHSKADSVMNEVHIQARMIRGMINADLEGNCLSSELGHAWTENLEGGVEEAREEVNCDWSEPKQEHIVSLGTISELLDSYQKLGLGQ
jgi:hypothetical protein